MIKYDKNETSLDLTIIIKLPNLVQIFWSFRIISIEMLWTLLGINDSGLEYVVHNVQPRWSIAMY